MSIIDFHSHILPGIDDGSRSLDVSKQMLELVSKQGVDYMIATPHFYATRDRIEDFLERREAAYESVVAAQKELRDTPQIKKGAEVAFFRGISEAEKIDTLTIEDTDVLLLEMPFEDWKSSYIEEVQYLIEERNFQIILAHLERYMGIKENKKQIDELLEMPLYVQINAESLINWKKRRKIVKLFRKGQAHLLGSDCHGIHHRIPNLGTGREILQKKAGQEVLDDIDALGEKLILEGNYV